MTATADDIQTAAQNYVQTLNQASIDEFALQPLARGARYQRVARVDAQGKPTSVHAFLEPATGLIFKPAGWKAPAKGARYDLTDPASYQALLTAAAGPHAYAGGYLYATRGGR